MSELSHRTRAENLERFSRETFDLLIIGGGITGAGIALEAASRGLKTALIEKGDFASGTSSKSSKLIHGGIRYLRQGDIRVTRDMARERAALSLLAPGLIDWTAFLFPLYGSMSDWALVRLGLQLYDFMSRSALPRRHKKLLLKEALQLAPLLNDTGLRAAFIYYDGCTDDARLVITVAKSAARHGAVLANYVEANSLIKKNGRIIGAVASDRLGSRQIEINSRVVINAAGAWLDQIRAKDNPNCQPLLFRTKGIHIVVPKHRIASELGLLFKSPRDSREMFVIPWGQLAIIGTTDTPFESDPSRARATGEDVEYVLEAINNAMKANLSEQDVISTFAGIRPLIREDKDFASDISRKHRVYESDSGLISIGGGKLTTFRLMAKEVVDLATKRLCKPIALPSQQGLLIEQAPITERAQALHLDEETIAHLAKAYGSEALSILELAHSRQELKERIVASLPYIKAEVIYCVRREMALTLADVLSRRTRIVWEDSQHGIGVAEAIAHLMASEMGWNDAELRMQLEAYREEAKLHTVK
jgi:glycerol-3-phosphate dehydrogenase